MQKSDGMNYAPKGKSAPVCRKGDFRVGVIGLDHGHIFGMCNGLVEAGAELAGVYDPDPAKLANFRKAFPDVERGLFGRGDPGGSLHSPRRRVRPSLPTAAASASG